MPRHTDMDYLKAQSYVGHINALKFRKETEAQTAEQRAYYAVRIDALLALLRDVYGFTIHQDRLGDFYLEIEDSEDEDEDEDNESFDRGEDE